MRASLILLLLLLPSVANLSNPHLGLPGNAAGASGVGATLSLWLRTCERGGSRGKIGVLPRSSPKQMVRLRDDGSRSLSAPLPNEDAPLGFSDSIIPRAVHCGSCSFSQIDAPAMIMCRSRDNCLHCTDMALNCRAIRTTYLSSTPGLFTFLSAASGLSVDSRGLTAPGRAGRTKATGSDGLEIGRPMAELVSHPFTISIRRRCFVAVWT